MTPAVPRLSPNHSRDRVQPPYDHHYDEASLETEQMKSYFPLQQIEFVWL